MSANDWTLLAWAAPFIAFCLGHLIGGRGEASYWASHGDDHGGSSVHHRGRFYRVTREGRR